ncbi:U3 small nucleolar RNA-associated protein 4 homolog, partial [Eumeta japonica]
MATKVHKVRYYNPKPRSINCVCYNKKQKHLALSREDASIEVWDLNHAPFLLKSIPGVENGSIEALGWASNRLFSTGLGGALLEWDLEELSLKTSVALTGYAAWCLDVNPFSTTVAVGTEQGYINLFSVSNNELVYEKLFDKQEGRIMCCKFDNTGNILVTGSINTIRVWNVETGHATARISASRRGKETIIWCLGVLSDNTIISGDNLGRLTFWDSTMGEQIETFTVHKADILAIAVSDDEKSVYCSGVDPVIVNFVKVDVNNKTQNAQWVKNIQRHIHEHDIRALVLQGEKLLSAGADGYLTFSSYPPKWVMRIPPMLPMPRSSVCPSKKLLLMRYINHIDIWKLGKYATKPNGKLVVHNINKKYRAGQPKKETESNIERDSVINAANIHKSKGIQTLELAEKPSKIASIHTKGNKQMKYCEMSPDGQYIMYSTDTDLRILKLELDEEEEMNASLSKVLINGLNVKSCEQAVFTEDAQTLILYSKSNLYVLQLDPQSGAELSQTIETNKSVAVQPNKGTTYLVAADSSSAIGVWLKSSKRTFEPYIALPKYKCVPSALAINSTGTSIVIAYVDQK